MGVRKTADFLEKATWTLAVSMLVFVLASSKVIPKYQTTDIETDTEIRRAIEDIPVDAAPFNPAAATQQPAGSQPSDEGGENQE